MSIHLNDHQRMVHLEQLIASIRDGDRDALAQLYHETSSSVYALALSILKNTHDAEDVLQDCFINIFQSAHQYKGGKPLAWILTITRNLCLMRLRQANRTQPLSDDDWKLPADSYDEEQTMNRIVLHQCISRLKDDERQIVVLYAVAGFKHRQIAQLLDLPLATVLSKYHRAIQKLKTYI